VTDCNSNEMSYTAMKTHFQPILWCIV